MTAITALHVRLGMDPSNFSEGAELTRSEVNKVAATMRQSVPPAQKYQQQVDLLDKAFSDAGKQSAEYANAIEFLKNKYNQIPEAIKPTKRELEFLAAAERQAAEDNRFLADVIDRSTPATIKYEKEVERLNALWPNAKRGTTEYAAAVEHLRQKHGIGAEAARRAAEAERQKNIVAQQGRQLTDSLLTPQERYNRKLADYQRLANAGAISTDTYGRAVSAARKELDRANASTSRANTSSMSLATSVRTLAGAYIGLRTVTQSIRLAIEVEQAEAAFEVLTGSAQNAAAVLADVRAFSETSPISFRGATDAAKMMMAFNIPVQEVARNIRMLGDISMGNQQRFDSLTLAFSQMSSAGRLMGQDLLQMINAGFNPLQEISAKTGETIVELKKRMEEGAVSTQEVTDAFISATSEGGRFNGMADKLSKTMGGQLQIASSSLEQAGARLGETFGPLVLTLTEGFESGTSAIDNMIWAVEKLNNGLTIMLALATDVFNNIASGATRTGNDRAQATYRALDLMEERERERERNIRLRNERIVEMTEQQSAVIEEIAPQEDARVARQQEIADSFSEQMDKLQMQTLELQGHAELAETMKLEADGYSKLQIEILQTQKKINKELEEKMKIEEKEIENAKKREEAFANEVDQALAAANQYFEQERQRDEQRRKEISAGPGAGIEAGSAGAAKFMADQVNAQIGAAVVPEKPTPGEKEIADKTRELLLAQRAANAEQARQSEVMRQQLAELKENRFTRIR